MIRPWAQQLQAVVRELESIGAKTAEGHASVLGFDSMMIAIVHGNLPINTLMCIGIMTFCAFCIKSHLVTFM